MSRTVGTLRLLRMMRLLLAQDSVLPPDFKKRAPLTLRAARRIFTLGVPNYGHSERGEKLSKRIADLGPTYIKLGQFLATRPDVIGANLAADLRLLQDKMAPFDQAIAEQLLHDEIPDADRFIVELGAPVAAASIAQVHRAKDARNRDQDLAVKLLRPNIETKLRNELRVFFTIARLVERFVPRARRLRPTDSLNVLQRTISLETDLRLEAAALSEMYENTKDDPFFTVPKVIWEATSKQILTMEWIDGTPASHVDALTKAGHDMPTLATRLIQTFLNQALRDGFFHADMHQGNLMIAHDGVLVGIDFGIVGRLDYDSRRFLAEILHGFITRDYDKVARVHFEAGYVPKRNSIDEFAQALRSIGEPIRDQNAENISMANLLTHLFDVTAQFEMETQPQLLLLQKTMVTVEGVARSFDPKLNIWDAAQPIVSTWLKKELGPEGKLREARAGLKNISRTIKGLPDTLAALQSAATQLTEPEPQKPDRVARIIGLTALFIGLYAIWLFSQN
jgi:ubiquinone biosynthesis protein